MRSTAERLLVAGTRLCDLRIVESYLMIRSCGLITAEEVAGVVKGSPKRANMLAMLLARLDPGSPDLHMINAIRFSLNRRKAVQRPPGCVRNAILSVPASDLPDEMQQVLAGMTKRRGAGRPLAGTTIRSCETVLRQLVHVARERGLPAAICDETMIAYLDTLDERKIAATTRHGYLRALRRHASRSGIEPHLVAKLAIEMAFYRRQTLGEPKRKVRKLAENPVTLVNFAQSARELLARAPNRLRARERRSDYLAAAALALLSMLPLRTADMLGLLIGQSLIRTGSGWQIDLRTSKTGFEAVARLHDVLTPYLDRAILLGTDESAFWNVYGRRDGTPFFAAPDGRKLGYDWLRWVTTSATGHPPHMARSLMHDLAAGLGEEGTKIALLLCQQSQQATAEHYKVHAERDAQKRAQAMLAQLGEVAAEQPPAGKQGADHEQADEGSSAAPGGTHASGRDPAGCDQARNHDLPLQDAGLTPALPACKGEKEPDVSDA
jgi:hypothetical protein